MKDAASALWFLESGRAGHLLKNLSGRKALRSAALPDEVRQAESQASVEAARAADAYARARGGNDLRAIRESRHALDEARLRVRDAVLLIQRAVVQQAALARPAPASLEQIRGVLRAEEALVLYGLVSDQTLALVLTPTAAKFHVLRKMSAVVEASTALEESGDMTAALAWLAVLRSHLVDPLALPPSVRLVLVSPQGPLWSVPFGALLDRPVALAPSGSALVMLRGAPRTQGAGILALGDSELRDPKLPLLPGARLEAKAVGDVVLVGAEANPKRLRSALASKARWRALHLACHALIDPTRPLLSCIALTPDATDDGRLSCAGLLNMSVSVDLVVLSADETATGSTYLGRGQFGLPRAFLLAGAPRIVGSLWQVDDEATQALMIKFYELWNPKGGKKGMGCAAALKMAQEYVRDHPEHPEWQHPYYWAAWVLWGLPE